MPSRSQQLGGVNNRVEQTAFAMQQRIMSVFERMARRYANDAIEFAVTGMFPVRKATPELELELLNILTTFGVRQLTESADATARSVGGTFTIAPGVLDALVREKELKLTGIMRENRTRVESSVRRIIQDAVNETPRPSAGEVARRIRTQFHGPTQVGRETDNAARTARIARFEQRGFLFSPERAALISRTEAAQTENAAIQAGYEAAGVEETEWLAYKSPIFKRRHDRMDGQVIRINELYENRTTGVRLRFPGDPLAPISETANCRCTQRARIRTRGRVVVPG